MCYLLFDLNEQNGTNIYLKILTSVDFKGPSSVVYDELNNSSGPNALSVEKKKKKKTDTEKTKGCSRHNSFFY